MVNQDRGYHRGRSRAIPEPRVQRDQPRRRECEQRASLGSRGRGFQGLIWIRGRGTAEIRSLHLTFGGTSKPSPGRPGRTALPFILSHVPADVKVLAGSTYCDRSNLKPGIVVFHKPYEVFRFESVEGVDRNDKWRLFRNTECHPGARKPNGLRDDLNGR